MSEPSVPFKVKSIFEYKSDYEDDLSFGIGKIITVIEIEDEEWYSGEFEGKSGMFPKNFVEIIPQEPTIAVPTTRPSPKKSQSHKSEPNEPITESIDESLSSTTNKPPISPTSSSISTSISSKVPLPFHGNQRINDPYSIKKQFVATGHSSYVPQVKPRDDSLVSHAIHDVAHDEKEIVKSTSVDENQEQEPEEPKVSLKDRIALLQKRQQEEAEREAAAIKKKEEKKKRQEEEKKRLKQKKAEDEAAAADAATHEELSPRKSIASHETVEADEIDEAGQEDQEDQGEVIQKNVEEIDAAEHEQEEHEQEHEEADEDEDDNEEDEAEDVSEDEDDKRRRLVERMAKMSGGRNMFGMMGMATPFGAHATVEKTPSKSRKSSKSETGPESPTAPAPAPSSAPRVPLPGLPTGTQPPILRESSSMVEEDSDSDDHYVEVEHPTNLNAALNKENGPISKNLVEASDSGIDDIRKVSEPIKITQPPIEPEATGYEADEDLSDLKTNTLESDVEIPPPPPPTKNTGTPLNKNVLSAPPVPSAPSIPTRDLGAPPPVPVHIPQIPQVPSAPPAIGSRPPPPPPPTAPPVPTAPVPGNVSYRDEDEDQAQDEGEEQEQDDEDDDEEEDDDATPVLEHQEISQSVSDDDFAFTPNVPARAQTIPTSFYNPPSVAGVPPIPPAIPPIPTTFPPPSETIRRASTDVYAHQPISTTSTGASFGSRKSIDSRSGKSSSGKEESQADAVFIELENDINSNPLASSWWLTNQLPDSLTSRIGNDLIFEIDQNRITKRGGREIEYKDYYILFYDLSQIVIELEYEIKDPRSTFKLVNLSTKSIPIVRKDLLDNYHRSFSNSIINYAGQLIGNKVNDNIARLSLETISSSIVKPIGSKSFGVTVYKNINNSNIIKIDEIKPGDILWIKNGKFSSHKGIGIGSKSIILPEEYISVIYEFDASKKDKLKVIENDASGHVKKESYKLSEFKSGRIRIFRPVARDYVGWS
ncbi:uncharacterized protein RJT21DRAFT_120507 [Scheffersomyces amazonensis]|uniref:uncharacterized protein n=1 Tax=Scheffersomyces amazonensis TaxID=1078765 RepID=UPI00315CC151